MTATTASIQTQTENEVQALSKWEALATDISIATEESEHKEFDYHDKYGNKEARSWISSLRRLKGKIERARKDAKSVHLERGRQVDQTAKLLESAVQGLIEPHEKEIKAIEAREQARVDAHRAILERIGLLTENVGTADDATARLLELESIDVRDLEEFSTAGANRKAEAAERLVGLRDSLRTQEAERAELEALRAEKARLEREREREQIRQEVIEEQRLFPVEPLQIQQEPLQIQQEPLQVAAAPHIAQSRESILAKQLYGKIAGKSFDKIALAIASGELHPAINIDWSKVEMQESDEVDW